LIPIDDLCVGNLQKLLVHEHGRHLLPLLLQLQYQLLFLHLLLLLLFLLFLLLLVILVAKEDSMKLKTFKKGADL